LGEDVEELCGWEGIEGSGYCVGTAKARWEIDAERKRWY
jgi:hypothetical protein